MTTRTRTTEPLAVVQAVEASEEIKAKRQAFYDLDHGVFAIVDPIHRLEYEIAIARGEHRVISDVCGGVVEPGGADFECEACYAAQMRLLLHKPGI